MKGHASIVGMRSHHLEHHDHPHLTSEEEEGRVEVESGGATETQRHGDGGGSVDDIAAVKPWDVPVSHRLHMCRQNVYVEDWGGAMEERRESYELAAREMLAWDDDSAEVHAHARGDGRGEGGGELGSMMVIEMQHLHESSSDEETSQGTYDDFGGPQSRAGCAGSWEEIGMELRACVAHPMFDHAVLVLILLNAVVLAIEDPSNRNPVLQTMDIVFDSLYTVEMAIRLYVMGPREYARDVWTRLDGITVVSSWTAFVVEVASGGNTRNQMSSIRMLRVLKIVKSVRYLENMREMLRCLFVSITHLFNVFCFISFLLFFFAVAGIQVFKGVLRQHCVNYTTGEVVWDRLCSTWHASNQCATGYECLMQPLSVNGTVVHSPGAQVDHRGMFENPEFGLLGFDNLPQALATVLIIVSMEGHEDVMYLLTQSTASIQAVLFVVGVVTTCSMFALNLVLAVIYDAYISVTEASKTKKEEGLGARNAATASLGLETMDEDVVSTSTTTPRRTVGSVDQNGGFGAPPATNTDAEVPPEPRFNPEGKPHLAAAAPTPSGPWVEQARSFLQKWCEGCKAVVTTSAFQLAINASIFLNFLILASEFQGMSAVYERTLEVINLILIIVFTLEIVINVSAYGRQFYTTNAFNAFDALIVIISLFEACLANAKTNMNLSTIRTLRLVRVLRGLRLLKHWHSMRQMINAMMLTLAVLGDFALLMLLFIFVFALVGIGFFGGTFTEDNGFQHVPRRNFENIGQAMLTVFQVLTSEDWNMVLFSCMRVSVVEGGLFVIVMYILGNHIVLSVVLAIVIDNFRYAKEDDREASIDSQSSLHGVGKHVENQSSLSKRREAMGQWLGAVAGSLSVARDNLGTRARRALSSPPPPPQSPQPLQPELLRRAASMEASPVVAVGSATKEEDPTLAPNGQRWRRRSSFGSIWNQVRSKTSTAKQQHSTDRPLSPDRTSSCAKVGVGTGHAGPRLGDMGEGEMQGTALRCTGALDANHEHAMVEDNSEDGPSKGLRIAPGWTAHLPPTQIRLLRRANVTEEALREYYSLFKDIDDDCSGWISKQEVLDWVTDSDHGLGSQMMQRTQRIMERLRVTSTDDDDDADSELGFGDFVQLMASVDGAIEASLSALEAGGGDRSSHSFSRSLLDEATPPAEDTLGAATAEAGGAEGQHRRALSKRLSFSRLWKGAATRVVSDRSRPVQGDTNGSTPAMAAVANNVLHNPVYRARYYKLKGIVKELGETMQWSIGTYRRGHRVYSNAFPGACLMDALVDLLGREGPSTTTRRVEASKEEEEQAMRDKALGIANDLMVFHFLSELSWDTARRAGDGGANGRERDGVDSGEGQHARAPLFHADSSLYQFRHASAPLGVVAGRNEFVEQRVRERELRKKGRKIHNATRGHTFKVLGPDHRLRIWAKAVILHEWFDPVVSMLIVLSCIVAALASPGLNPNSSLGYFIFYCDMLLTLIFFIEALLKILTYGFIGARKAYLRSWWNVLDFLVVVISVATLALELSGQGPGESMNSVKAVRGARALRALRTVQRNPGLKRVIQTVLSTLPLAGDVTMLLTGIVVFFSVIGLGLYRGLFSFCDGDGLVDKYSLDRDQCHGSYLRMDDGTGSMLNLTREWVTPANNFDNLLSSVMTLFEVGTLEQWPTVLNQALDVPLSEGQHPVLDGPAAPKAVIFFISYILLASLLAFNLVVGVIISNFAQSGTGSRNSLLLTPEQQGWVAVHKFVVASAPAVLPYQPPKWMAEHRQWVFDLVQSDTFENCVIWAVLMDVCFMGLEFVGEPQIWTDTLFAIRMMFNLVYILELSLRLWAWGPKQYFHSAMNRFDCFLVCVCALDVVFWKSLSSFTFIRLLRLARLGRLVRLSKTLYALTRVFILSLPALVNVGSLFLLVFFIYGVLGMNLFGLVERDGEWLHSHNHFDTFGWSVLVLWRCSTGGSWNGIMHYLAQDTLFAYLYFISFVVLTSWLLANLLVAIVLGHFAHMSPTSDTPSLHELIDAFRRTWAVVWPEDAKYMPLHKLPEFILALQEPLGLGLRLRGAESSSRGKDSQEPRRRQPAQPQLHQPGPRQPGRPEEVLGTISTTLPPIPQELQLPSRTGGVTHGHTISFAVSATSEGLRQSLKEEGDEEEGEARGGGVLSGDNAGGGTNGQTLRHMIRAVELIDALNLHHTSDNTVFCLELLGALLLRTKQLPPLDVTELYPLQFDEINSSVQGETIKAYKHELERLARSHSSVLCFARLHNAAVGLQTVWRATQVRRKWQETVARVRMEAKAERCGALARHPSLLFSSLRRVVANNRGAELHTSQKRLRSPLASPRRRASFTEGSMVVAVAAADGGRCGSSVEGQKDSSVPGEPKSVLDGRTEGEARTPTPISREEVEEEEEGTGAIKPVESSPAPTLRTPSAAPSSESTQWYETPPPSRQLQQPPTTSGQGTALEMTTATAQATPRPVIESSALEVPRIKTIVLGPSLTAIGGGGSGGGGGESEGSGEEGGRECGELRREDMGDDDVDVETGKGSWSSEL